MENEYIKYFELKKLNVSKYYAYTVKNFLEHLPPLETITADWCLSYVASIENLHTRKWRTRQLKMVLKFFDRLHLMAGISIKEPKPSIRPSDLITEEEYNQMLYACKNEKERAIIEFLFFTGCRSIELLKLRKGDIVVDNDLLLITLSSKGNTRTIPVFSDYVPNFLFYYATTTDDIVFQMNRKTLYTMLKRIYKTSGVTRRRQLTHIFRHTRATILAQEMSESLLRQYMGWSARSDMPYVYVHLSNKNLIDHFKRKTLEITR